MDFAARPLAYEGIQITMNRQDIIAKLKSMYMILTDGTVQFVSEALAEDVLDAHPHAPLPVLVSIVQSEMVAAQE